MPTPTTIDFTLVRGDSLTLRIELVDEQCEPYDPSGIALARWQAYGPGSSTETVISLETPDITFLEEDDKHFALIPIPPEATEPLSRGTYKHEFEMRNADGTVVVTPFRGAMKLESDHIAPPE